MMLTSQDLREYIVEHGLQAEVVQLSVVTPTVGDAARAVNTSPDRIVKSLLFLVDDQPVLAISSGEDRVDRRCIAGRFGVGRKRVKLADAETALEITGFPVGAIPPFGHAQSIPTLIDKKVLEHEEIYAGGGAIDSLIRVSPGQIVSSTGAVVMDLLHPGSEGE